MTDEWPHVGMPSDNMSQTDQLLMLSLTRFYHIPANIDTVLPFMSNTSSISLRMIDWFVTNYSKKHNVVIESTNDTDGSTTFFDVYLNYRAQLKAYSKQQFDPFKRRDRIILQYDEGRRQVQTTVGQLNFFRWLMLHGVLKHVTRNSSVIEADMMQSDRCAYRRGGRMSRRSNTDIAMTLDVGILHTPDKEIEGADAKRVQCPQSPEGLAESVGLVGAIGEIGEIGAIVSNTNTESSVNHTASKAESSLHRRRTEISKAVTQTMNQHTGRCTLVFS